MKTPVLSIMLSLVVVLVGASGFAAGQFTVRNDLTWSVTKSPQTGRCYEVAGRAPEGFSIGYGFMGISEIPCDEVGL